jgi:transcriptional regulator with XRE-family HTH domain
VKSTTDAQVIRANDLGERARVNRCNLRFGISNGGRSGGAQPLTARAKPDVDRQLRVFLQERRRGIDRNVRFLGNLPRQRTRWGLRVTQEELAEALGVSRVWYATFESGACNRVSTKLLNRVATVLTLDERERVALFGMAVPELRAAFANLSSRRPETLVRDLAITASDELG